MKIYNVCVEFWRESFNGHDQNDGTETFNLKARNCDSARNKAIKLATKSLSGNWVQSRWFKIKNVREQNNVSKT